jgi:hypothetical protein
MSTEREEAVYLAKLAEQAERYEEMVNEMKKVRAWCDAGPSAPAAFFIVRAAVSMRAT